MADRHERWWVWVAFAVLCAVGASRWLLADRWPEMGSTLRSEAWACAVGAAVCAGVAVLRRRSLPETRRRLELMLIGMGLLAMPIFAAALQGPAGESLNRTIALAFVPVVALTWGGPERLWPGLAGLAGALLVLPFTRPPGVAGYFALALVPLAVGAACALSGHVVREVSAAYAGALVFAGGGLGLAALEVGRVFAGGVEAQRFSAEAVALDLLEAALVVAVVLRAGGVRYAARYFIVLLLMLAEGVFLLHQAITLRVALAMVLLAVAAAALLRGRGTRSDTPGLQLR